MKEIINSLMTNQEMLASFSSILIIIFIAYLARKRDFLPPATGQILNKILLSLALPCMTIVSFMTDLNEQLLRRGLSLFFFSVVMYVLLILLIRLFYKKYSEDKAVTLLNMSVFGSSNLFAVPVVQSLYGSLGVMLTNIFNIPYRLFLYTYSNLSMRRSKRKQDSIWYMIFRNPLTLFTLLSFFLWIFQDDMPQVQVAGETYSIFRLDQTAYWLYKPMDYLSSMLSPLAWLIIGIQLGDIDLKATLKSSTTWYYALVKLFFVPLFSLSLAFLSNHLGLTDFDTMILTMIVIVMATPTSNIIINYALEADREPDLAVSGALLTTVLAVFTIPIWVLGLNIVLPLLQ